MKRILLSPESAIAPATGAPPATPAPAPAPRPSTPEPKASDSPNDPFSSMDDKITAARKVDVPKDKKVEPKADEKPDTAPADKPKTEPKALREQLDKVNGELKTERASMAELQRKIKEYEAKGKDSTTLAERLAAREKEFESLQGELRALKHEASPEFKAKYEKPFNRAATHAKQTIEQLQITEQDGSTRRATWDDFGALYNLPLGNAMTMAKELFGDGYQVVISHLTKLKDLEDEKKAALVDEKEHHAERSKADEARKAQEKEFIGAAWLKTNSDVVSKHPEWYQPDPEDKEGNELLKEGYDAVDAEPATTQDRIIRDAYVRNRAAAFPRLAYKYDRAQEQIKELQAQVAELSGSLPGKTRRTTTDQPSGEKSWKSDLAEAMQ